jgi:hypothetical protein
MSDRLGDRVQCPRPSSAMAGEQGRRAAAVEDRQTGDRLGDRVQSLGTA